MTNPPNNLAFTTHCSGESSLPPGQITHCHSTPPPFCVHIELTIEPPGRVRESLHTHTEDGMLVRMRFMYIMPCVQLLERARERAMGEYICVCVRERDQDGLALLCAPSACYRTVETTQSVAMAPPGSVRLGDEVTASHVTSRHVGLLLMYPMLLCNPSSWLSAESLWGGPPAVWGASQC